MSVPEHSSQGITGPSVDALELESKKTRDLLKENTFLQHHASSISSPASQRAVNHLVLNTMIPGLGTLLHGRTAIGLAQLSLAFLAIPIWTYQFIIGIAVLITAYVWSIASGVLFTKEKEVDSIWDR